MDSFERITKYYLRPFLVIWTIFGKFGKKAKWSIILKINHSFEIGVKFATVGFRIKYIR